ncbi:hypothetical protein KAX02_09060 [candidate division WOR-3 bacterium]|nr:hypothetical protein [candidate division WOR-3 bacterium]
MKASILKPIVWNDNQYMGPTGQKSSTGYPAKYGFGHEEWNNHPGRIWRGFRIFHTESTDRLLEYSGNGNLGILMIASHAGAQWAVGIAAAVDHNEKSEMLTIANELHIKDCWKELWSLQVVRQKFHQKKDHFLKFWEEQYFWLRWRCPQDLFYWFQQPIQLNPASLSGKQRLTTMYGRFQPIRPESVVHAVADQVPQIYQGIIDWFLDGEFDENFFPQSIRDNRTADRQLSRQKRIGTNVPPDRIVEYWVYGKRTFNPHHHLLQARFIEFLKSHNLHPMENIYYIDIQYERDGNHVLVEVKPTDTVPPRYALRASIGQLFEYQYRINRTAQLEVVFGTEPENDECGLAKHLGIRIWYPDGDGFTYCGV